MHDVTLVYTEYNHRLEVWVLGKRAANTTADRQQYTNTSKVCDDTMSMARGKSLITLGLVKFLPAFAIDRNVTILLTNIALLLGLQSFTPIPLDFSTLFPESLLPDSLSPDGLDTSFP